MVHPNFTSSAGPTAYRSQNNDSILEFSSKESGNGDSLSAKDNGGSFSWRGSQMDRLGTYQLQQTGETYHLELSYNYAREATYLVTFLHSEQDTLISFRLTDHHGRQTEFTRI